jgi:hypothetical protein
MSPLLEYLLTDDFGDAVGFALPPAALRLVLHRQRPVRDIAAALRHGQVKEAEIRNFASALATEFHNGVPLRGDLALAAIAVVLEHWPTDFAEEYLCHLARLQLPEMGTSLRVARECLKNRYVLPRNQVRTDRYQKGRVLQSRRCFVAAYRKTTPDRRRRLEPFARYARAV